MMKTELTPEDVLIRYCVIILVLVIGSVFVSVLKTLIVL